MPWRAHSGTSRWCRSGLSLPSPTTLRYSACGAALDPRDDGFLTTLIDACCSSRPNGDSMRSQRLTLIIFIGMVLGIAVGYACHQLWPDPQTAKTVAGYISLFTDIFLRLIKMIIAPLVFTTLVVGVAHMGDTRAVGRIATTSS